MPPRLRFPTTVWLLATACTPSQFAWQDDAENVAGYRAAFAVAVGARYDATASYEQLVAAAAATRVLWLGDHHRSVDLHRLQLELLERVARTGRPLALVLEAIATQDEALVRDHLAGGIDGPTLRRMIRGRWPGSWLDDADLDFAFYRQLLAFATRHGSSVYGLEPAPRGALAPRDAAMAERVRNLAAAGPERLVVVVVGQAHLVGAGDVVARCGLPALTLGGEPPAPLREAPPPADATAPLWRSDGGLWWFAARCRASGAQPVGARCDSCSMRSSVATR